MKLTTYLVIFGGLGLSNLTPSIVCAQPKHQVAPTTSTAVVDGLVQDGQTKQPIAGASVLAKSRDGVVRAQQATTTNGAYQLTLDPKQSYILTIKADGYVSLDEQITFTSPTVDHLDTRKNPSLLYRDRAGTKASVATTRTTAAPVHTATSAITSPLPAPAATTPPVSEQPAVSNTSAVHTSRVTPPKTLDAKVTYTPPPIAAAAGKTTQLQALQFVQSKAELLPDAQPALEQLLAFMRDHATAEIELAGHTDNQGDFDENLKLSKQRVELVKDYLVKNGIAANRVTTRGYGPTRPIASNNSETTRKLNRRVEMTVLKE
ncbi:OmpA family protein [Spirosoma sp. KCTC 42546]|uniref:OmpA family protein n=1 Tax=Spirosoma sp. KCTC 42546 TaxID=2520506 RepID=UPI00115923B9|nr:OmpA family protein [Spirosoma sp. KCTC 42546]QDK78761.1 OmpA family protein [Spirosoma sp. KCTC 42546]